MYTCFVCFNYCKFSGILFAHTQFKLKLISIVPKIFEWYNNLGLCLRLGGVERSETNQFDFCPGYSLRCQHLDTSAQLAENLE